MERKLIQLYTTSVLSGKWKLLPIRVYVVTIQDHRARTLEKYTLCALSGEYLSPFQLRSRTPLIVVLFLSPSSFALSTNCKDDM